MFSVEPMTTLGGDGTVHHMMMLIAISWVVTTIVGVHSLAELPQFTMMFKECWPLEQRALDFCPRSAECCVKVWK